MNKLGTVFVLPKANVLYRLPLRELLFLQRNFEVLFAATYSFECLQGEVETHAVLVGHLFDLVHESFEPALFVGLPGNDPFVRLVATLASTLVKEHILHLVVLILQRDLHGLQVHLLLQQLPVELRSIDGLRVELGQSVLDFLLEDGVEGWALFGGEHRVVPLAVLPLDVVEVVLHLLNFLDEGVVRVVDVVLAGAEQLLVAAPFVSRQTLVLLERVDYFFSRRRLQRSGDLAVLDSGARPGVLELVVDDLHDLLLVEVLDDGDTVDHALLTLGGDGDRPRQVQTINR